MAVSNVGREGASYCEEVPVVSGTGFHMTSSSEAISRINQYFDGRKTDDEILYCADITRKQLREVLHHYEDYVSRTISTRSVCVD